MTRPPTRRAVKAYRDFTGHEPSKVRVTKLDDRDVAGWKMGPLVGVAYEATRDNETRQYFHEFKKSSRPDLIARDDGRKLYIAGGSYKITERGVEDMPALFTVNPSPRSRVKPKRKARPMAARRRRSTSTRRRATRQMAIFRANPIRRRRRRRTAVARPRRARAFRANPIRRRRRRSVAVRRMRRNPSARRIGSGVLSLAIPAMGIGAGAVGSEILMGYLPIPVAWKTGVMRHVTKGAVGVAAGMLLGKVFRMKRIGNYFALGAIAIATHDALKEAIASRAPGIPFGQYVNPLRSQFRGMGYINPAATARLAQYVPPLDSQFEGMSQAYDGAGGETDFRA